MARRGTFIVLEGTDGSGKGTQFKLLRDRLLTAGYQVETCDFPQYDQPSSYFVTQYLNGAYGSVNDIGPYTASLFYALDRYEASSRIRAALDRGAVVIANRFTGSSMGHQGAKFSNAEERRGFFIWLDNLEFEMLHIPRPDASFVLRVPAEVAEELIDKKEPRTYTDKKRDIHEADHKHLERSVAVYDDLCQLFPRDFKRIDCVRNGTLLDVESIQHLLWERLSPLLPQPNQLEMPMATAKPAVSEPVSTPPPKPEPDATKKPTGQDTPQPAAEEPKKQAPSDKPEEPPHEDYITNTTGDVYAFTSTLSPALIATVMATLSRSSGILSTTVLKAFADAARKDSSFIGRVLATYGDESVRELVNQQVVVSGASALLAQKLQWGRMAAYTGPQPEYIRPEQKNADGAYKYFTPPSLTGTIASQYAERMDAIFTRYAAMLPRMSAYLQDQSPVPLNRRSAEWKLSMEGDARALIQAVVPIACTATVGVYASAQSFETLIIRLLGDELPEAQQAGEKMLRELRKTIPDFLVDVDRPDRGGAETVYRATTRRAIETFAKEHMAEAYAPQTPAVQLTDLWPRNEFDLVPDMLYAKTNLPLDTIRQTVANWSYEQKLEAMDDYLGERLNRQSLPGRALEKAHYSWDLVTPFSVFRELQGTRVADDLEWQLLTPRAGYEVPDIIDDAGLADLYEECFDISLGLHSVLQQAGYELEAQYATLAGHRMRWKVTHNARQAMRFFEAHSDTRASREARVLMEAMHERLSQSHPTLGDAMQFVGMPEDAELNELATERYKQFKTASK